MEDLAKQIMFFALMAVAGWLYFYICLRQLIFDFAVGYKLIKVFDSIGENVFGAQGARRLNTISVVIWTIICIVLAWVVIHFCDLYLIIGFFVGAAGALLMYIKRLGITTRSNFNAFCGTYCRFIADDELRQAAAQYDVKKMNALIKKMGSDVKFEFVN